VEANQADPQQVIITVVNFREVSRYSKGNEVQVKVQVGFIPLQFTRQTSREAAKKLLDIAGFPQDQDPAKTLIKSALGTQPVEAYLEAVRTTTPLIILFPIPVQGYTLTPALLKAAMTRFDITRFN
jgi:hypothetical protein